MQITNFDKLPALRLSIETPDGKSLALRDGQTITATVRQAGADGSLTLEIGGRMLEARSTLRMLQGMVLQLRVEREQDQVLLRLDPQQVKQLSQDQAMRQLLPRQESLKPLLEQLHQAGLRPASLPSGNPGPTVQQAIGHVLAQLPTLQQVLSPQGLQQVIADSGLFLEHRLLHPQAGVRLEGDVKNILLRLAQLIRQAINHPPPPAQPTSAQSGQSGQSGQSAQGGNATSAAQLSTEQLLTLLKQSEASLARIQVNQLTSLTTQGKGDERLLNIEIPPQLQKDIAGSGIFLEHRLLHPQAGGPLEGDVKNILLRLAQLIRQTSNNPPSPVQPTPTQSEVSLAKIQVNQPTSLTTQGKSDEHLLSIKIPIQLQKYIADSGLFLEHRLLHPQAGVHLEGDVKNILLRLAQLIRQAINHPPPPAQPTSGQSGQSAQGGNATSAAQLSTEQLLTLLKQSEASLARIQVNQLTSLTTQGKGDERLLNIEIPLLLQKDREPELLRLQIRRETRGSGEDKQAVWSVRLQLDPEDYGHIEAVVSLMGGKVSTTFWCEKQTTSALFSQHLEELSEQFRQQGLEPGSCRSIFGKLPPDTPPPFPASNSLIDIQA